MDKQSNIFSFMHGASKVVFIIPLVIIGLALIFKIQELPFLHAKIKATPTPILNNSVSTTPSPAQAKIKLDLNGPYICDYTENQQSLKAYVKNKNIYAQLSQGHGENLLVKGDCYYKWEQNQFTGEKVCGISTYIGLYETMAAFSGGVDLGTLLSFAQFSNSPEASVSGTFIQSAVDSCKKQEVNDSVFTIPYNISFKETTPRGTPSDQSGSSGLGGIGNLLNLFGK